MKPESQTGAGSSKPLSVQDNQSEQSLKLAELNEGLMEQSTSVDSHTAKVGFLSPPSLSEISVQMEADSEGEIVTEPGWCCVRSQKDGLSLIHI